MDANGYLYTYTASWFIIITQTVKRKKGRKKEGVHLSNYCQLIYMHISDCRFLSENFSSNLSYTVWSAKIRYGTLNIFKNYFGGL